MSLCPEVLVYERCRPTRGPLAIMWGRLMGSKGEGSQVQAQRGVRRDQRHWWPWVLLPGLTHSCSSRAKWLLEMVPGPCNKRLAAQPAPISFQPLADKRVLLSPDK